MSPGSSFIASLLLAQTYLYRLGGSILLGLGTVSCVLSLAVFSKRNLRKNPCSIYMYLIAYHIASLLLIYTTVLPQTLTKGYNIDPTLYNLAFCRIRFYTTLLVDVLGPSYIILASIDWVLLTSQDALMRQRSTAHLACVSIMSVTLFWWVAQSHTLALCHIMVLGPGLTLCYFQLGDYNTFIRYYTALVKGILVPLLLLIFGLLAIRNARRLVRVAPTSVTSAYGETEVRGLRLAHSKDRQLIRILLIDVSIYLIFSLMLSVSSSLTFQLVLGFIIICWYQPRSDMKPENFWLVNEFPMFMSDVLMTRNVDYLMRRDYSEYPSDSSSLYPSSVVVDDNGVIFRFL